MTQIVRALFYSRKAEVDLKVEAYRGKVSDEEIEKAKRVSVLSYLSVYEPYNLRQISHGTWCLRDHDSLKISNGKWYWFSRRTGGHNALDFMMKVRNCTFIDAVRTLSGNGRLHERYEAEEKKREKKKVVLPAFEKELGAGGEYLMKRGISPAVIYYCDKAGILKEETGDHSLIFLGYDMDEVKFACKRSIKGDTKTDLQGSDKSFSFVIKAPLPSDSVHVTESAIDAMSLASIFDMSGNDWHTTSFLSLSGVGSTKEGGKLPAALRNFLDRNPEIRTIYLHLDNDIPGRASSAALVENLSEKYNVIDSPAPVGKDMNDYLHHLIKQREERELLI